MSKRALYRTHRGVANATNVGRCRVRWSGISRRALYRAAAPAVPATANEVPSLALTRVSGSPGDLRLAVHTCSPGAAMATLPPLEDPFQGRSTELIAATAMQFR